MVISAPTGAGKTVLFEIGMLRIFRTDSEGQIVYLAPTKSLCTERVKDWREKFATCRIKCESCFSSLGNFGKQLLKISAVTVAGADLTGDTSVHAIQEAKTAKIM
jgi:replicative superfamily II helicase